MNDPYIRRCQVLRVIDGDTLRLRIDLGWNVAADHNVRLLRVNAPEPKGATKAAGDAATAFVKEWIRDAATAFVDNWTRLGESYDWPFVIRSEKADAFGRYLVEFYDLPGGVNLNDDLVAAGHAVPFMVERA